MEKEKDRMIAKLYVLLCDVLEHFACSEISYANGNEAQGVDEGEFYGQRAEKVLVDKINNILREIESI